MGVAPRLTDRKKKKIVADYLELGSYNAVARKNGVSHHTVQRVVMESPEIAKKIQQKKEENTADIIAYMEHKREMVCEILEKGLCALNQEGKLAKSSPVQITTAIGTLIDKWAALDTAPKEEAQEDSLSRSLRELGEEMKSDQ